MPAVELFCLALGAMLGILLLSPSLPVIAVRTIYGLFLSALALQLFVVGPHWQLFPLYVLPLLAGAILFRTPRRAVWLTGLRAGVLGLTLASLSGSLLLPMFRLPPPTGHYAVATRILHLVDPTRADPSSGLPSGRRELMVQVWYPIAPADAHGPRAPYRRAAETTRLSSYMAVLRTNSFLGDPQGALPAKPMASDRGPLPAILFNPAWHWQRTESTFLAEDLASHGFVVVGIDHTGNSGPVAFPDGTVVRSHVAPDITDFDGRTLADQQRQGDEEVRLEAADDRFVLDEFTRRAQAGDSWFRQLDLTHVGALGHSFGGAAALQTAFSDPRVLSAVDMDGWVFGDAQLSPLRKPVMYLYEEVPWPTPEQLRRGGPGFEANWALTASDAQRVIRSLQVSGGYRLALHGTLHNNFADRPLYSPIRHWTEAGRANPQRAHTIIRRFVLAFFSATLRGETAPRADPDFASEVDFERYPAPTPDRTAATAASVPPAAPRRPRSPHRLARRRRAATAA